ncbi:hypothetical protein EX30DRAFT_396875 [Ascodesmis nigricans]|uniref:Tetratricopeptide SHNi-TPR domain-containing protein n=1 Tax=Ascodesmis nigricans TaxID=341454 RepID=A0A4S2MTK3_9PEZI|nr:hypothetical protein EX30DRAFT_396875 [Ascodesmis nigricans]
MSSQPAPPAEAPTPPQSTESAELATLKARALKASATRSYSAAADLYSQACALQSQIHGSDTDPRNAPLLYLYGRALYNLAQSKSDVLGGRVDAPSAPSAPAVGSSSSAAPGSSSKEEKPAGRRGLLQFAGDENWDDDDEEEGDEEDGEDAEDGEDSLDDDFEAAWQILDLTRTLLEKQLPENLLATITTSSSLPPITNSEDQKSTLTLLADTHDLLGSLSLETSSFPNAVKDLSTALMLKEKLYPLSSTLIAEAHFKLSLALEFTAGDEDMVESDGEKLREAAAEHVESAIASCRARIEEEERKLQSLTGDKGKGKAAATATTDAAAATESEAVRKEITNVQEMITELEQRLEDLRNPEPPQQFEMGEEEVGGLLGQILAAGGDKAAAKRVVEEAVKGARELGGGVVRRKEKRVETVETVVEETERESEAGSVAGKRKAEVVVEEQVLEQSKKVRVEEVVDSGL